MRFEYCVVMGSVAIGSKIYVLTTIIVAATTATGAYLYQVRQGEDQFKESSIAAEEPSLPTAESELPDNDTNQQANSTYTLGNGATITLTPGLSGGKISSPLTITGSASGSQPVKEKYTIRLIDPSGNVIVNNSVSVSGSGSSNGSSNFSSTLNFSTSVGGKGSLQITGSGDTITIPVEF